MAVSEQRLGKHVSALTNTHATIEARCFRCGPCRGVIKKTIGAIQSVTRVEAGSNTFTVTLRVVGGD
jgi:hypothetical protein